MAFVRTFFFLFIGCTVAYWLVSIYSRSIRTEKLEKRWDAEQPEGVSREDYVKQGLTKYDASFRRRLIVLIYVVPFVAVFVAIWLTNYGGYR